MSKYLIVPIRVDALLLTQHQPVAGAMADFSRLPHWVPPGVAKNQDFTDYNSDVPFLSESILSEPFEDQGLYLHKGVHLHWALPDTLTRTRTRTTAAGKGKIELPVAPNRWLVIRTVGEDSKQWVVESDYVHPPGETNDGRSIVYPAFRKNADESDSAALTRSGCFPWRCLGRATELTTPTSWQPAAAESYLPGFNQRKLTALGWGDPNFAAFYPNCHSVFGFHDEGEPSENKITYEVIGWHADANDDILSPGSAFLTDAKQVVQLRYGTGKAGQELGTADIWQKALEQQLKWKADPDATSKLDQATLPNRSLYYGKLTIEAGERTSSSPPPVKVDFALGNTGTEALSAWLAQQDEIKAAHRAIVGGNQQALTPEQIAQIEDRLEAVQLDAKLSSYKVDRGFKFREARHEKGFVPINSGQLWTVRPVADPKRNGDGHAAGQPSGEGVTLPEELAHQLNALNDLQRRLDQACDQQVSLQRRLYADWCLYQMACYPPEDERESFPEPERMKYFMENGLLPRIDELQATIDAIDKQISTEHANLAQALPAGYELKTRTGARYWRPADPVILMAGSGIEATPRHGEDGVLDCFVIDTPDDALAAAQAVPAALKLVNALPKPPLDADSTTWAHPWHPYLLEWEAEILPVPTQGNLDSKERAYEPAFVTQNFSLPDDPAHGSDLVLQQGQDDSQLAATLVSGRCILTPHASRACAQHLAAWLQKHADHNRLPNREQLSAWVIQPATDDGKPPSADQRKTPEQILAGKRKSGKPALAARLDDGCSLTEAQRDWIELCGWKEIIKEEELTDTQKKWMELHKELSKVAALKAVTLGIPDIETLPVPDELKDDAPELIDKPDAQKKQLIVDRQAEINRINCINAQNARHQANFNCMQATLEFLQTYDGTIQSQSLGGFHESLLGQEQVFQLPLADPLGFPDMQAFVEPVSTAVGNQNRTAPLPLNDFLPLRTGFMRLLSLRVLDTFGQAQDLLKNGDLSEIDVANTSSLPEKAVDSLKGVTACCWLPPRFSQPARVNFRWLSAGWEDVEMNTHPATSPICGWLLPNNLDQTLQVHAADGSVLGILCEQDSDLNKSNVVWQPRPGNGPPIYPDNLPNTRLRRVVNWIIEHGKNNAKYQAPPLPDKDETETKGTFLQRFLLALDSAQENMHPAEFEKHESLALLMGRPIAVVRAAVSLEVQGLPAANHSWPACWRDLERTEAAEQAMGMCSAARTQLIAANESLLAAPSDLVAYKDLPSVAKDLSSIARQLIDAGNWVVKAGVPRTQATNLVIHAITPADLFDLDAVKKSNSDPGSAALKAAAFENLLLRAPSMIGWTLDPAAALATANFNLDQLRIVTGNLEAVNANLLHTARDIFGGVTRTNDGFDAVKFPLRIGEFKQLNDGLYGYWLEADTGPDWRDDTFYATQSTTQCSDNLKTHKDEDGAFHIPLSLADDPVSLTMLVDPRGVVHATSGVLPTKDISIPSDQYAKALKAIQVFFLSTPVLTPHSKITLPLPKEEGYSWAWLTRVQGTQWLETTDIAQPPTDARHTGQQIIVEGWLRLDPEPVTETPDS